MCINSVLQISSSMNQHFRKGGLCRFLRLHMVSGTISLRAAYVTGKSESTYEIKPYASQSKVIFYYRIVCAYIFE